LLLECRRPHIVVRSEEPLRPAIPNGPWRCRTAACRQTRPRGDDGQVPCHHPRSAQLLGPRRHCTHPPSAKAAGVHGRHRAANMHVVHIRQVRESHATMERTNATEVVDVNVRDVHNSEASPVSTPPGVVPVTGAERHPSESAPATHTDAETPTATPAPE